MLYETFKKSWKDLDARLFIPVVLLNLANLALFLLFLALNGLMDSKNIFKLLETLTVQEFLGLLGSAKFVISGMAFLLLSFAIRSGFLAMKFAMPSSIVKRKSLTTSEMLNHGVSDLGKVLSLRALTSVVVFVVGFVVVLASVLVSTLNANIGGILLVVLALIAAIILGFGLLFRYAIMFMLETNSMNAIKRSFNYAFSHIWKVIAVVLITVVVAAIPMLALQWLNLRFAASSFVAIAMTLLGLAYSLVIDVWSVLFIFNAYNSDKNLH